MSNNQQKITKTLILLILMLISAIVITGGYFYLQKTFFMQKEPVGLENGISNAPFVAGQLIVKYKDGKSPDDLQSLIDQRVKERSTPVGFTVLLWKDLMLKLQKQQTPDEKLEKIIQQDLQNGVISKELLYKDSPNLKNAYLIKFKDGDMAKKIRIYKNMEDIEYAEPNYIGGGG